LPRSGGLTIALAGGAGSGKSTVAAEIAARLGGRVAAFGDYVRHLAASAGESPDRTSLQRVGQSSVEAGPADFVRDFLSWAAPTSELPLVIDGVRHAAVDEVLRAWASAQNRTYILIILDTDIRTRAARRSGGEEEALRRIDGHPVEREAWATLPELAEIVVDGSGSAAEVIKRIAAVAPDRLNRLLQ
jgi:thymidylate kinase